MAGTARFDVTTWCDVINGEAFCCTEEVDGSEEITKLLILKSGLLTAVKGVEEVLAPNAGLLA